MPNVYNYFMDIYLISEYKALKHVNFLSSVKLDCQLTMVLWILNLTQRVGVTCCSASSKPCIRFVRLLCCVVFRHRNSHTNDWNGPGPTFIKPDQLDPWIKDQMKITLLSTVSPLQLPNFVSCGRDKPSHMKQNLVTVGTAERFLVDPWSMDQADLVW